MRPSPHPTSIWTEAYLRVSSGLRKSIEASPTEPGAGRGVQIGRGPPIPTPPPSKKLFKRIKFYSYVLDVECLHK